MLEQLMLIAQGTPQIVQQVTQDPFDVWVDRVSKVGLPLVVVLLILYFIWKYGPKLAEGHLSVVNQAVESSKRHSDSLKEIGGAMKELAKLNASQVETDAQNLTEHQKTHRCLLLLAQALAIIGKEHPEAAKKIEVAIDAVNHERWMDSPRGGLRT